MYSKDVFHAFLVTNATYAGNLEIPELSMENAIPHKLIPFSKIFRSSSYDSWIHFYEDDVVFERLWNNPKRYLPILQRFQGVISPDFSLYRDMPLVIETTKEGFQNWVRYQNGTINEGGRNLVPRIWNNSTGLNNNPIKRRKMLK